MTTTPSPISYGRGQTFTHGQEIVDFTLNNGNAVKLTANNGGFLLQMRAHSGNAVLLETYYPNSLHEAILATRRMAQDHGGVSTSPAPNDHKPGEQILNEKINGYDIVLERTEYAPDRCWDVYATNTDTGKTGDVWSYGPDEYLVALNAYDELYFEIEHDMLFGDSERDTTGPESREP